MSYAVRNDGKGWRAVGGPEDCSLEETWQKEEPPLFNDEVIEPVQVVDPVKKLKLFLQRNPDVADLLK